jgi:hypothetical protein
VLGRAVLGRAVLGRAVLGRAVLGLAQVSMAVWAAPAGAFARTPETPTLSERSPDPMADTTADDGAVTAFVASLDERTAQDTRVLLELMQRVTGHEPRLWNVGTIGFDSYHYRYDSGREGDSHCLGFYPRKGKTTVYLMDGTARHAEQLADLGTHTTSRVCLYLTRLSDIDLVVLERVLRDSYDYLKAHDGTMRRTTE